VVEKLKQVSRIRLATGQEEVDKVVQVISLAGKRQRAYERIRCDSRLCFYGTRFTECNTAPMVASHTYWYLFCSGLQSCDSSGAAVAPNGVQYCV